MNIEVKYFGKIAEVTKCNSEKIDLADESKIFDLRDILIEKYPDLKNTNFKLAHGEILETNNVDLLDGDVIALLPPFAGG